MNHPEFSGDKVIWEGKEMKNPISYSPEVPGGSNHHLNGNIEKMAVGDIQLFTSSNSFP